MSGYIGSDPEQALAMAEQESEWDAAEIRQATRQRDEARAVARLLFERGGRCGAKLYAYDRWHFCDAVPGHTGNVHCDSGPCCWIDTEDECNLPSLWTPDLLAALHTITGDDQ